MSFNVHPIAMQRARHGFFRHNERTTLRGRGNLENFLGKCIGHGQKTGFREWRTRLFNSIESVDTKLIGTQSMKTQTTLMIGFPISKLWTPTY